MKGALKLLLFVLSSIGVFGDPDIVVSVLEGDSVTLHTNFTVMQSSDTVEWRFNSIRIARISSFNNITEGTFKDRLEIDKQTGDLIIRNIRTTETGQYQLKIKSSKGSPSKTFNISVTSDDKMKKITVLAGDLVTLLTDVPEMKEYKEIQWRFGHMKSPIAEIKAGNFPKYDETDKRFKEKLQLDPQTGSLTIKNIITEQSGLYEANIIISDHTIHKLYIVNVSGVSTSVLMKNAGESVTLHTNTNLQAYDFTLWSYEGTDLAEIYKAESRFPTYDGPNRKFSGRLKLDEQTGDLTITDAVTTDTGKYDLKITSSRHTIHKIFTVAVNSPGWSFGAIALTVLLCIILVAVAIGVAWWYHRHRISKLKKQMYAAKTESLTEGNPVTLHTGCVLQGDSAIIWQFEGKFIAKISGQDNKNTELDIDAKFTGRLRVDSSSGSLTISETTTTDSGCYKVKIDTGGKHFSDIFIVTVAPKEDEDMSNPLMRNSGNNV